MSETDLLNPLPERIRALKQSGLLAASREDQFGYLVEHVRDVLDAPVAIVTLVDENRQVFAGHSGLPAPWNERGETPITHSFCRHVVERGAPLFVPDARLDPLLKDNDAIGDIGVVAYLGVPLALPDGEIVGALAAIQSEPRAWSDGDMRRLRAIANMVEKEMAVRISERRWHRLFESLQEGFLVGRVVRNEAGRIVDWRYEEVNAAWYDLVGLPRGSVVGRTLREVIPGIEEIWIDEFAQVVETGERMRFTRQVGPLGRWYDGFVQALDGNRFTVIFVEVTDWMAHQRRQEALIRFQDAIRGLKGSFDVLAAATTCLVEGLPADRVGFGPVDWRSEIIDIEQDWCAPGIVSVAGRHEFRAFGSYIEELKRGETVAIADVATDPRTAAGTPAFDAIQTRSLLNLPIVEDGNLVLVVFAHGRDARVWTEEEVQFVAQVGDRTQAALGRIRAEETQAILNAELSHRLKNSFAMVQAIASQTLKGVSERKAVAALSDRLRALSQAHDVLMQESWSSARLGDVARTVLAIFEVDDRFAFDGPNIEIGPRATLSLSLLLHELGTNASKYGALSVPEGRVELAWRVDRDGEEPVLHLSWRERGGPPAEAPEGAGFGSRIIRMGLIGTGDVDLSYATEGLTATMSAPLSQMQRA